MLLVQRQAHHLPYHQHQPQVPQLLAQVLCFTNHRMSSKSFIANAMMEPGITGNPKLPIRLAVANLLLGPFPSGLHPPPRSLLVAVLGLSLGLTRQLLGYISRQLADAVITTLELLVAQTHCLHQHPHSHIPLRLGYLALPSRRIRLHQYVLIL